MTDAVSLSADPVQADLLLAALAQTGPPMAVVEAAGVLAWCSASFSALLQPAAAGVSVRSLIGDEAASALAAQGEVELMLTGADGSAKGIGLRVSPPAGGRSVITVTDTAELRHAQCQLAGLQERLDLVQELTQTGIFERDPVTMQGSWDHHLYRIYGLPPRPPGAPAPDYDETAQLMVSADLRPGAYTETLKTAGLHSARVRLRWPDGQIRHVHSQWKVFHDAQGRAVRVLGCNRDDTEVHELAQQAESLRTDLDAALSLGRVALWRYNAKTDCLQIDPRGSELIGIPWTAQGMTLAQARDQIHPDDRSTAAASAAQTLRTGEPSDMLLRYPKGGGQWRNVMVRRALLRGAAGDPIGFVGVLLDVSESAEQTRLALEASRRLEAAADAARIGLWSSEVGSALPSWNPRMYQLFGLDPQAGPLPIEDWLRRCVHPSDRERVIDTVRRWWHSGSGAVEVEFRLLRPADGELRWLVVRGNINRDAVSGARRAEGVAIDVTEPHHMLLQLHETIERMALIARALGLGTWQSEAGSREVVWDAQMFQLRGVESGTRAVLHDEIASYLHPEDRLQVMDQQVQLILDGRAWRREFRILRPDGEVRWITSHSVPLHDAQGSEVRRLGVSWDSTDTHQAEQALRERELAVAESRAKSTFMSRISHELRTPLNAMLGFTQLLREAGDTIDAAKRARWLSHVEDAGRHLLAMIDDVLELSRSEVGELRVVLQPVHWASLVEATLPLVAASAQDRQVQLLFGPLDLHVLGDPVRLRQVLLNLLSNAIKYNRPGGQVRVQAERDGARVVLRVTDTGVGIDEAALQHAFEPFNRLGAEASSVEGTGIGLAIVKVLVERMGGRVGVRSVLGEGSEFEVGLPAADDLQLAEPAVVQDAALAAATRAGANAAVPAAAAGEPAPARLLYIEDNPVNAMLLQELLANRPAVAIEVAEDGRSGVERARATLPDLVLIDMQLPDIDGHAVLQALRCDAKTAGIRCVALSANATPADLQTALDAGFTDYWTKPIEFRHFLDGLSALLGRPV